MRIWVFILGGLTIWAAHFFLLYAFASLYPGQDLARILTLIATIPAVIADAAFIWLAAGRLRSGRGDDLDVWVARVGGAGAALSLVAVIWQALPALLA